MSEYLDQEPEQDVPAREALVCSECRLRLNSLPALIEHYELRHQ